MPCWPHSTRSADRPRLAVRRTLPYTFRMTERKNSSSRNWRGEGSERGRNPANRRSPSGATKSNFPAEARYWGRVNSEGAFEEAPGFPEPRYQFPWRALGRGMRSVVPHLSSAVVGALSALVFQTLLAQPTATVTQPAPTIIVNPAPVAAAAPPPAPVVVAPEPVAVVVTPTPQRAATPRLTIPLRPRQIRSTSVASHPSPRVRDIRPSDPDAILEPSF